ncbi:MAG TPA: hypothetical protein VF719_03170, partial [Abditibacteriaceae bacterium]
SFVLVAVKAGDATQVKRRVVKTGPTSNGNIQIVGGVRQGDLIITGNQELEDGDKIKIVTA